MGKKENHKQDLIGLLDEFVDSGDPDKLLRYIALNSNLPGQRANLELASAFSEAVEERAPRETEQLWKLVLDVTGVSAAKAPVNSPEEFIPFCGAVGIGSIGSVAPRFLAQALAALRELAKDPRWRMREAVCMGLQRLLAGRRRDTLEELERWVAGRSLLEMRAAAAAVASPVDLKQETMALSALQLHRTIMDQVLRTKERKSEAFRILRKALGYTLSVVVAAVPEDGFEYLCHLIDTQDPEVLWIVKQNLKKNRLLKNYPKAVESTQSLLE